jgi:hypothetical protein
LVGRITGTQTVLLTLAVSLWTAAGALAAGPLAEFRLLVLGGEVVKWGAPKLGAGAHVTYAIATETIAFAGARNCSALDPIEGLLAGSRIDRTLFEREVESAFAEWSDAADVTFERSDEKTANILIGAQAIPTGRAFTNVSFAGPAMPGTPGAIVESVICLNPEQAWKIGFNGDLDTYDLRYTLMHEIGHALGLDHPGVPGVLMDFRYLESFSALQGGDRMGIASLYGPRTSDTAQRAVEPADAATGTRVDAVERAFGARAN